MLPPGGLPYVKGHGTHNDFVVVDDPDGALDLSPGLVAGVCDRRGGVGADGLLRVVRAAAQPQVAHLAGEADWFMDYRNADGGPAEMCGNGIRVFARWLVEAGHVTGGRHRIATRAGLVAVEVPEHGDVSVGMGVGRVLPRHTDVVVRAHGNRWPGLSVDTGNPHTVVFVDDLAEAGPLLDAPVVSPRSVVPDGTNVEFVMGCDPRAVAMRVYERGVGETRSCGTGACAVALAAAWNDRVAAPWEYVVDVPGGRLVVAASAAGELTLTGPAVLVSSGLLRPDWLVQAEAAASVPRVVALAAAAYGG